MPSRTTTVALTESADRKARLFKKVTKMDLATIVSDAIEEYIPRYLKANDGVRAKYEAEEAQFLASAGVLVIPRRKRSDSTTATNDSSKSAGEKQA